MRHAIVLLAAGLFAGIIGGGPAFAQEAQGLEPSGQPGDRRPPLIEKKPLGPPPSLVVPQPPPDEDRLPEKLPLASVYVREINVTGSTVFSEEDLAEVTASYEGRQLTSEDLEALRKELTVFYINNGFVTSGAVIPDQTVTDGVVRLHIIEGRLKDIAIENNKYLRDSYYRKRIARATEPPLQIANLQEQLVILQADPRIRRLNAELKPGPELGESHLDVTVEEKLPLQFWAGFDNYISESVGGEQIQASGAHLSLTGNADVLSLTLGAAEGLKPKIDAGYSLPVTARDTSITLRYRKNDFDVVRDIFEDLDIETDSDIYSVSLRDPVYRSANLEIGLEGIAEHQRQKTTLMGLPFSFEPGAVEGEVKVSALRFAQDLTYRTRSQVIAARSQFSLGVDALDATTSSADIPDGRFFAWLGQFQWLQRLPTWNQQLFFRTYAQFSDDALVSLEQYAVGGRFTVRGYPENFFVRDNAVVVSLETRIPLIEHQSWADYVQVVPFFDYGWAENKSFPNPPGPTNIYSVGIGLRWAASLFPKAKLRPQFEVYYGYKLKDVDIPEDTLQEKGIHFQFAISAL